MMIAMGALPACSSAARHVERNDLGRACRRVSERDDDEARDLLRPALASELGLSWRLQLLSPQEASEALGVPVVHGEHGAVARIAVTLTALPRGAESVHVHLPAIYADEQRIEPPYRGDPSQDLLLPAPADLVEVEVPEPYQRAPFEVSEPPPRVRYVPGTGKEPAPSKMLRDTVEAMTLGLVKGSAPGPRLTDESRRKLTAWRKRHQAEFDAWVAHEDGLAAENRAARRAAMDRNTEVFEALRRWEADRAQAWNGLVEWPCRSTPLPTGETCEGLLFVSARGQSPLTLRFMAATEFSVEDERCTLTLSGVSAPAQSLEDLLAPWAEPTPQHELAPADYVAAMAAW